MRDSPRPPLTPPWLSPAAARRAKLRRGARAAGRQDVQQGHREARPPGAGLQPGPAQLLVRAERPHPDGHDRALRYVRVLSPSTVFFRNCTVLFHSCEKHSCK
jgi:hypothetical protein